MQHSCVLTALLIASATCHAQSSVNLYGVVDAALRETSGLGGNNTATLPGHTALTSGVNNTSVWGLKGQEDLGGGWKAVLRLEGGVNVDTGSQAKTDRLFDRHAWVGLDSPYGLLALGRQPSLISDALASVDPLGNGAAQPDIHTVDGLRAAFLQAKHVAYSDSASGEYIKRELLDKLGIRQQMEGKAAQIPATPVGEIVAHGDADFGCQQRSELQAVKGIDIVGLIPQDVQLKTEFSGAVVRGSPHPDAARALLRFLSAPANAHIIEATGLEPVAAAH